LVRADFFFFPPLLPGSLPLPFFLFSSMPARLGFFFFLFFPLGPLQNKTTLFFPPPVVNWKGDHFRPFSGAWGRWPISIFFDGQGTKVGTTSFSSFFHPRFCTASTLSAIFFFPMRLGTPPFFFVGMGHRLRLTSPSFFFPPSPFEEYNEQHDAMFAPPPPPPFFCFPAS